jgi:hypothetical protein
MVGQLAQACGYDQDRHNGEDDQYERDREQRAPEILREAYFSVQFNVLQLKPE